MGYGDSLIPMKTNICAVCNKKIRNSTFNGTSYLIKKKHVFMNKAANINVPVHSGCKSEFIESLSNPKECDCCGLQTPLLSIPTNKKGELYCPACEELFP